MTVTGVLLAAGAGTRFGEPKALVRVDGEPLVRRGIRALVDGGCDAVTVVLGARADEVRAVLPHGVHAVFGADWDAGMGASLRAGLATVHPDATAALVHLVDLPGVGADVVAELRAHAGRSVLARACYQGAPGHPVLFGSEHLPELIDWLGGDEGARGWLRGRSVTKVECGHLGHGEDLDTPEDGVRLGLWSG